MVPYEAFLSEKPVVTTTDAGGPLEIVRDRETGVVVAPEARRGRRGVRVPRRATSTRRRPGAAPGKRSPSASPGTRCIDALLVVKVAYYSPLPPSRSGIADYSALLLPALRERVEEVVRRRAGQARAGGGRRALPRRQRPRLARLDRRRAAQAAAASSSCTSSCCTT